MIQRHRRWSIGIYTGNSPTELQCPSTLKHGVLHAEDVTDTDAASVADPFMVHQGQYWYLFFEVMKSRSQHAVIGLAKSPDLRRWQYQQIVLQEPFHVSYPHVFEFNSEYYMTLETLGRQCVSLYRANPFPTKWSFVTPLILGYYADPSILWHDDNWWLFVCSTPGSHDVLRLFNARRLTGPWCEHPTSPIVVANSRIARPAGRIVRFEGRLIRYAQDCVPRYGTHVRAFSIDTMTSDRYVEHETPDSPGTRPWH